MHLGSRDLALKLPSFLYDPVNVDNLISAFSKPCLDVWKFLVCIMLKPSMQDFKHEEMSGIVHWFEHSLVLMKIKVRKKHYNILLD